MATRFFSRSRTAFRYGCLPSSHHFRDIILQILDKNPTILSQPGFSVNVTALADFSVNLKVQLWVNTTETLTSSSISLVQESVIQAFAEHEISIPYPVQEVKVYRGDSSQEDESARAKAST